MNVPAAGGQPTLKLRLAKQAKGGRLKAEVKRLRLKVLNDKGASVAQGTGLR